MCVVEIVPEKIIWFCLASLLAWVCGPSLFVKVVGPVVKGDLLLSSDVKGHAKVDNNAPAGRILGKAMEDTDVGEHIIEALINLM